MKPALALVLVLISTLALASGDIVHHCTKAKAKTKTGITGNTSDGGWVQNPEGEASFTAYSGCQTPSCGISMTSGYTAAVNLLSFGAYDGTGDACGRCFKITPTRYPDSRHHTGSMGNTIVVRATDLCPFSSGGGPPWCNQTVSKPVNQHGMKMHFDLCEQSGASSAFFPSDVGAMLGNYTEVSCSSTEWQGSEGKPEWQGSEGGQLWGGACMGNSTTPLWPQRGCGNRGSAPYSPY
jgi:hypothetical protein